MLKRFEMSHPKDNFDIIVTYNDDNLSIEDVTDTDGEPVELCESTRKSVLEAIAIESCEA